MSPPLERLQHDVLAGVFTILASLAPPVRALPGQPGHLGWILTSHVCQNWRAVLLDMPLLWAKIVGAFPSTSACRIIFSRSGDAPVTFWPSDDMDLEMMYGEYDAIGSTQPTSEVALRHLSRVEAFGWRIHPESHVEKDIAQLVDGNLRQMRNLSIDGIDTYELAEAGPLFAPVLETLFLRDVSFLPHAPCLRALHLHYTNESMPHLSTFTVLAKLPLLEELDLHCAIKDGPIHSAVIELPRLASLQYSGKWSEFLKLWSAIAIEPTTNMELQLSDHVEDVFAPMRAHLSHQEHDSIRLSYDGEAEEFGLQVFSSAAGSTYVTASGRAIRSGVFVCLHDYKGGDGQGEVEANLLISALIASLVPTDIRSLDLDMLTAEDHRVCDEDTLRAAILPLTNVDTVIAGRDSAVGFLFVLLSVYVGWLHSPLFPNLKTIFFKDRLDTVPCVPVKGWDAARIMEEYTGWRVVMGVKGLRDMGCHLQHVIVTKMSGDELDGDLEMIEYQEACIRKLLETWPGRGPCPVQFIEPQPF